MTNTIKYIFWGIRTLSGKSDAVIDFYGTPKITRIIYTIVTNIFFFSAEGMLVFARLTFTNPLTLKLNLLRLFISSLNCCCYTSYTIIGLDWNNQFSTILEHICNYDMATNFPKKTYHPKINHFRIAILIPIIFSIIIVIMRYQDSRSYFLLLIDCFFIELLMQMFSFCGLLLSVYQRFDHLNQLIPQKDKKDNKVGMISFNCDSIGLQKSWWLHWHLTKATEIINQVWSIQLFLWIGKLFSTILVKTYSITYNIQSSWRLAFYDAVVAISALLQLYIIVIFCHVTSEQANKVAQKILTSMKIQNKEEPNSQNKDLANAYFCTKKIRFTAAHGLFKIHLPLIISIIGATTTYFVILCKTP